MIIVYDVSICSDRFIERVGRIGPIEPLLVKHETNVINL